MTNSKTHLGVLMPSIYIGGGENATKFLILSSDKEKYCWEIVVVTGKLVTWEYLWEFA